MREVAEVETPIGARSFVTSAQAYDRFMGRYSRQLAVHFADFAGIERGMHVLDVGAGTGALTAELLQRGAEVAAAEPSEEFVAALRERYPAVDVQRAPAEALPWNEGLFDAVVSQLVVTFLPDGPIALQEQRRVTRKGGVVAACMWELEGSELLTLMNDVRTRLGVEGGERFERYRSEADLRTLFEEVELEDVATTTIEISSEYGSVDDLWDAAVVSAGPGGAPGERMSPEARTRGREIAAELLGRPSGSFTLHARCACVRGIAP